MGTEGGSKRAIIEMKKIIRICKIRIQENDDELVCLSTAAFWMLVRSFLAEAVV